jgi:hypothetical protein
MFSLQCDSAFTVKDSRARLLISVGKNFVPCAVQLCLLYLCFENPEHAELPRLLAAKRGLILHKLIEELLTGEPQGGVLEIQRRTVGLLTRSRLVPEYSVIGHRTRNKDFW